MITIQKGFIKIVYCILLVNSRASGSRHPWIYSPRCTKLKTINLFFMCNFDINILVSRRIYLNQVHTGYRPARAWFLKIFSVRELGLRELCSKISSLFYSEFPQKSLHYACYYSFYTPQYCHYSIFCTNDNKVYKLLTV